MREALPFSWPRHIRGAIFDFDGTLADTADLWHQVDGDFLARHGFVLEQEPDYPERLAALGFVEGARYTIDRFNLDMTVDEVCTEWQEASAQLYRQSITLREGAERCIRALRDRGIACALATTNDPLVVEAMELVDIPELFGVRVYGKEVGRGKDHPDIFLEAARRLEVEPTDIVVFEDIVPAILSAASVGMATCGVRANDPMQDAAGVRAAADFWLDDWHDAI